MINRIGIFGDSWGCGEWTSTPEKYYISHKGLAKYLIQEGFKCIQYSKPGGSNYESLNRLITHHNKIEWAIFILTEPFRDFLDGRIYQNNKTYFENVNFAISDTLETLKKIQNNGTKILLVNGLFELENQNFVTAHISFCKTAELKKDWPKYYGHPGQINQLFLTEKKIKIDKRSIIYDVAKDTENFETFFANMANNKNYFFPDGTHPNRKLHKLVAKKIIKIKNGH